MLLTGTRGDNWVTAAKAAAAELGVRINTHRIGVDLEDTTGRWPTTYGVTDEGAVLVRPDGFVA